MQRPAESVVELAGVSYSLVYKRVVTDGEVPGERDGSGVWTIARRDVKLLELLPKADDKRVATMVRVPRDRHEAWQRAAGDRPVTDP